MLSFGSVFAGAKRIAQTSATLTETGFGWLLGKRPPAPMFLRQTFEKLGTTYIKLGQFIASSPSLFPEDYVREFQKCLDQTTPIPYSAVVKILREEFGDPHKIFLDIDSTPMASASIAQVHAGKLRDGTPVVLKIQKPGVKDVMLADLSFLYAGTKVLELLIPNFKRMSLSGILEDISTTILQECDFELEAQHLVKFGEFLQKMDLTGVATVPKTFPEASTARVLTMERLYGVPMTDLESIRQVTSNPEETLIRALNVWMSSLMLCDFFHADLHAGNLLVLRDGRIGFIDFGIVGKIQKKTWRSMNQLMVALNTRNYKLAAQSLIGIGAADENANKERFSQELKALFEGMDQLAAKIQTGDLTVDQTRAQELMLQMAKIGERNGIKFPREFALLIKQFLYFDRYIRLLAPELDMIQDPRIQRMIESND
ncbi:MAG: AarF/ABC1/UbiB kinase family protein [Leptospirales bacterium]|nr:AarF/ABC1/UbiB kinase family protein [Leptospirales bacterium]